MWWAETTGDPILIARAQKVRSIWMIEDGFEIEAVAALAEGLRELPMGGRYQQCRVELMTTMAVAYVLMGQYHHCLDILRTALRICTADKVTHASTAVVLGNMALSYLDIGDYRRGITAARAAVQEFESAVFGAEGPRRVDGVLIHYAHARLLMQTGQVAEAARQLAAARTAMQVGGTKKSEWLIQVGEALVMIHEGQGRAGVLKLEAAVERGKDAEPYEGRGEAFLAAAHGYELAGLSERARSSINSAAEHMLTLRQRRFVDSNQEVATTITSRAEDDGSLAKLRDRGPRVRSNNGRDSIVQKIESMAVLAELPEYPCGSHAFRVGRLSYLLARGAGYGEQHALAIAAAGRVHDVGKVVIPAQLLCRRGALSAAEQLVVRTHAQRGEDLLRGFGWFDDEISLRVTRNHHERWDGRGYPDGLAGEAIPLEARVVALAESFDAMTHERPGRPAISVALALEEIHGNAGRQFDPRLAAVFIECVGRSAQFFGDRFEAYLAEEASQSRVVLLNERIRGELERLDASLDAAAAGARSPQPTVAGNTGKDGASE
jgi:putative two-component system response regulator